MPNTPLPTPTPPATPSPKPTGSGNTPTKGSDKPATSIPGGASSIPPGNPSSASTKPPVSSPPQAGAPVPNAKPAAGGVPTPSAPAGSSSTAPAKSSLPNIPAAAPKTTAPLASTPVAPAASLPKPTAPVAQSIPSAPAKPVSAPGSLPAAGAKPLASMPSIPNASSSAPLPTPAKPAVGGAPVIPSIPSAAPAAGGKPPALTPPAPRPLGATPAPLPGAPTLPPKPGVAPVPSTSAVPSIPGAPASPVGAQAPAAPSIPGTQPSVAPALPGAPKPTLPPAPPAGSPPAGAPAAAGKPPIAAVRKSPLRFLPFVLGAVVLAAIAFFAYRFLFPASEPATTTTTSSPRPAATTKQTTVTYWGLWEPSDALADVLKEFEQANPGVKVEYVKQSHKDYRERLQTAIASGSGPDVFRYHASWVPMLKAELSPLPSSIMSSSDFQQTFYPVASKQLQSNGQIVGIPLMYEGLALYYNKDVLRTANAQPPQDWASLRTLATQLTVRSGEKIERGGLAIGTAGNVEHFSDIIGLLMLQNGANLANPTSPEARDALTFYTNFAKVDRVWDQTLPSSTVAFARGDVAMMFAPSWRAHEVIALNPQLSFGIAPLPKLSDDKLTWASYWAEGVSAQSKNKDQSWALLKFLSSKENMKKLYSEQSQIRTFGEPFSRVDLANDLSGDAYVSAYLSDAPAAQGWYLSSYTHDNGINDQMIKYYEDAINAINGGRSAQDVLTTLDQGTKQVLRQYGVSTTTTTP